MLDTLGQTTSYWYDVQDRLIGIRNQYSQVTTIGYDPLDRELTKIYGNNMVLTHVYDSARRETARQFSGAGSPLKTAACRRGHT